MLNRILAIALVLVLPIALSACGNTRGERALTGAGIGAAGGALGGAIVGEPAAGAVIGGAAGAATGAVTDKDDIDLGDPIWE